jgi:hypothetical protein
MLSHRIGAVASNEFVFRYNRRFYRHVSFEALLGLATHQEPTGTILANAPAGPPRCAYYI